MTEQDETCDGLKPIALPPSRYITSSRDEIESIIENVENATLETTEPSQDVKETIEASKYNDNDYEEITKIAGHKIRKKKGIKPLIMTTKGTIRALNKDGTIRRERKELSPAQIETLRKGREKKRYMDERIKELEEQNKQYVEILKSKKTKKTKPKKVEPIEEPNEEQEEQEDEAIEVISDNEPEEKSKPVKKPVKRAVKKQVKPAIYENEQPNIEDIDIDILERIVNEKRKKQKMQRIENNLLDKMEVKRFQW